MKNFLLLFRGGDARMADLSEKETTEHMEKWNTYMGELAQKELLAGGLPLSPEGWIITKDGASEAVVRSEKGEAVGGYLLIKANDYNHAHELTKACPIFEHDGNVEIRETLPM